MINSLKLLFTFWTFFLLSFINSDKAIGETTPDGTIPTKVERSGNVSEITGGSEAGNNLFHSFEEFSVDTNQEAFFNNADNITNIFSRVTGSSVSEIDGLIRANGSANLFLLNPNGIIFGENSSLDIGGSFFGTTADSLIFQDETVFDTQNPQNPLLTIDVPIGLQIGADAGSITNRSQAGLEIASGQNLTLVGGEITIDSGKLIAPGGKVNLAGLSSAGLVEFDRNNNLNFSPETSLSNILLSNRAEVDVRGNDGGSVAIDANNFSLEEQSSVLVGIKKGLGTTASQAGDININATGTVDLTNGLLSNSVPSEATGQGGNVIITTGSLFLNNDSLITTSGQGDAGYITIRANNLLSLDTSSFGGITSIVQPGAVGQAGDIDIDTNSLSIVKGAVISAISRGDGNAGNIKIKAADSIVISGTAPFRKGGNSSGIFSSAEGGSAIGGKITIDTRDLRLSDGGVISSRSRSNFDGGDISVNAQTLEITDGGQILTTAFEQGNAGNIDLNVSDRLTISGSDPTFGDRRKQVIANFGRELAEIFIDPVSPESGIYANTEPSSTGDGGNISINSDRLNISDEGRISVATEGSGDGGNISLETQDRLILRNNSQISATAEGETRSNGGNITINTDFIIASPNENSDILTRAFEGDGGEIDINADSLFGIEERIATEGNETNDIDASSEFGLSGTVEINTPDVDRDRDLVQLPTQPTQTQIVPACTPDNRKEQSEFVIKGSGGLPPSPESVLDSDRVEVDWVTRSPLQNSSKITNPTLTEPAPIIEAQGWMVDGNEIVLVGDNSQNKSWQNSPQCLKRSEVRSQKSEVRSQKSGVIGQELERQNPYLLANNSAGNILIASVKPKSSFARVPERIIINRFEVEGNRAFDSDELASVLAPYTDKPLSFTELLQARSAITEYYTERGYITSGAYIPLQRLQDKTVKIQVVEGYLEDIEIKGNKRLNSNYLSRRIKIASSSLQREELLSALQLLQQDPLIASLSAELEAGTRPGASVLEVEVKEADSFKIPLSLDNRRTPSVGSFRRQLALDEGNLLGFGDNLFLAYGNTEGSDAFDGSYSFPFNARNGTLTVNGGVSSSEVVEEPFNQLNILGDSHYYELSLRQPVLQTPTQEFALGITASRRESDISSLIEQFGFSPSELSPGADESGQTRVSALRFFQEWTSRNEREVIAARSQFSLGLDAFNATVNESAPDSRFFAWLGQAQWARELAADTLFLLRGGIQLSSTSLLSSERIGLGGIETVRGYRQDVLLSDRAVFASAELRVPVWRIDGIDSVLQVAPFFDVGTGWNSDTARAISDRNTLASLGLGLRLLFSNVTARFDWGIPLISVDSNKNTWQENGLHFSLEYNPF